ncbi:hypothetical protein ACIHFE_02420 [Streptomyces sp. NPDC052396]|uniref:hypothetical protein n=1 Tax=Streptomyces sp. NPDC052396 TaxID=3365689 RepID=UPI0037CD63E9
MTRDQVGRLIGGIFGTVFIQMNAGALPKGVGIALRVLALVALLGLLIVRRRGGGTVERSAESGPGTSTGFGRRYWYVAAVEAVALVAGLFVINGVLHAQHATVGWIALVVGVHFFGLAAVWRRPSLNTLAGGMTLCGLGALALAACGASAAVIATVGGIAPGVLLLGSIWWGARTGSAPAAGADPVRNGTA